MEQALKAGLIDDFSIDVCDVVRDADLIIISVPILAVGDVLEQIKSSIGDNTVLTDVGSVKGNISKGGDSGIGRRF